MFTRKQELQPGRCRLISRGHKEFRELKARKEFKALRELRGRREFKETKAPRDRQGVSGTLAAVTQAAGLE
jgi:hypothetical protein